MNRRTGRCLALLIAAATTVGWVPHAKADDATSALQDQLKAIEDQIASDQKDLAATQGQANTLANAVAKLAKQQAVLALQMKASDLQIADAEARLADTEARMKDNGTRQASLNADIAEDLQAMNKIDRDPPLFSFLRTGDFFVAVESARQEAELSDALAGASVQSKQLADALAAQQVSLTQAEQDAQNLQNIRALQSAAVSRSKADQQSLLTTTKGKEQAYLASIADQKAQAAQIRQRLYQLLGVATNVTFGDAVKMAQWVSSATGIRPAFLLSVLSQESNLGANVGTCNRPGDPPEKSWKVVMKPDRDQGPFVSITSALGRPPDITPVSCPMHDSRGRQIGWGGAMGPAQFIPSTWLGYEDRVTALTGHAADPWDIRDAFAAAAIKLVADGGGSQSGEWAAAMRYFSGSTDPRFRFYGDEVTARAAQYQKDIDTLGT